MPERRAAPDSPDNMGDRTDDHTDNHTGTHDTKIAGAEFCPPLGRDAALAERAVRKGADLAMEYFRKHIRYWDKGHNDPVSEADVAVDHYLRHALMDARPGYGWLSEETRDSDRRLACGRVWVVDPIDGTRAFLEGRDDWGVSVALVEMGVPQVAAFYAPARDAFYMAVAGQGATKNGESIHVSDQADLAHARMMGDPDAFRSSRLWPEPWPETMTAEPANSIALRLCQIADSQYDCCVTLRPKNDWDMAAADLILREAGGRVTTGDKAPLIYNRAKPLHRHIVAGTPGLMPGMMQRVVPALNIWRNRAA